jgi:RNA polymerase sigma factor (sigma-70 family)
MARLPLTAEQQQLVNDNLALARHVARPFRLRWRQQADDITSAAVLGLCEAAASFDPSRGLKFVTFAHRRIRGAVIDHLRSLVPPPFARTPDLAPTILPLLSETEDVAVRLIGAEPPEPPGQALEESDDAERLLRRLPPRQQQVLRRLVFDAQNHTAVAAALGLTVQGVSARIRKARELLTSPT